VRRIPSRGHSLRRLCDERLAESFGQLEPGPFSLLDPFPKNGAIAASVATVAEPWREPRSMQLWRHVGEALLPNEPRIVDGEGSGTKMDDLLDALHTETCVDEPVPTVQKLRRLVTSRKWARQIRSGTR
jgi:hypothetical protein